MNSFLQENEEFIALYKLCLNDDSLLNEPYNLDLLKQLSETTLGQKYASHMLSLNLNPNFYPAKLVKSEIDFLRQRLPKTHDI